MSTDNDFSHSVPSLDTERDAFGQTDRSFVPLFLLALRRLSNIMIEDESFPPSRDLSRSGNVGISEVTKAKSRGLGAPIGISGRRKRRRRRIEEGSDRASKIESLGPRIVEALTSFPQTGSDID